MTKQLIKARILGLVRDVGLLLMVVILGALSEPQFTELIHQHFGGGLVGSAVILLVSAGVSHAYNLKSVKKAKEKFGSVEQAQAKEPIILI